MVEWRAIPEWEGLYEVSDDGQVRSLDRAILGKNGATYRKRGQLLALSGNNRGYWMVHLKRNRARTPMTVHKAVLNAFVGPRPHGLVARHLDGNPHNNNINNLKWGTYSENGHDAVGHGRNEKSNRESCPLDHILAEPNLTLESIRRGHRDCLACKRAGANQAYARRRGHRFDFAVMADEHYREIMTGERPATTQRGRAFKGAPRGTSIRGTVPAQPVAPRHIPAQGPSQVPAQRGPGSDTHLVRDSAVPMGRTR